MNDANDAPPIAESLDEPLNHAAEELITGDSATQRRNGAGNA